MWNLSAVLLAFAVTVAHADWKVQTYRDPLTDKTVANAELVPQSGPGKLSVHCVNGTATADLVFAGIIGFGTIGATYRFDDGPVTMRIAKIPDDGRTVWLWFHEAESIRKMTRASRLRVQLEPIARPAMFIDFDMTGAKDAISKVKC